MYNLVERENEIMDTLNKFAGSKLKFVVVGGYGVSAYRHRFSVDADVVIKKEDEKKFGKILKEGNYRKTISRQLRNIYSSEFVRYEKKRPKVNIDLLIDGVCARQTGASFGFEFLIRNSTKRPIEGIEKAVKVHVPRREVLIILKLHSGRLTDFRDVAALSFNLNLNIIQKNIFRGNKTTLRKSMKKLGVLIEKPEFQNSFKGVFMEKNYRINSEEIRKLVRLSAR